MYVQYNNTPSCVSAPRTCLHSGELPVGFETWSVSALPTRWKTVAHEGTSIPAKTLPATKVLNTIQELYFVMPILIQMNSDFWNPIGRQIKSCIE
jgi:hypothetical protein